MKKLAKLEEVFVGTGEVKGMIFTQIASTNDAYLYQVDNNESTHYEVIKRLDTPLCIDFKNRKYSKTDFKEYYPKANRFGIDGWTFTQLYRAIKKMKEI